MKQVSAIYLHYIVRFTIVCWTISITSITVCANTNFPIDASTVRQNMKPIIDFLDSTTYANRVSWEEHAVLVYHLASGRDPSSREFRLLMKLRGSINLPRSSALSFALRGEKARPTWVDCQNFADRIGVSDFSVNSKVRESARMLSALLYRQSLPELGKELPAVSRPNHYSTMASQAQPPKPNITYQTYFGFLHAHSELSDGSGSPLDAYTYARDAAALDFFALSDHGEHLDVWPWEDKWEQLVSAAEKTYEPGRFATLWGFEWSSPFDGHMTVVNTDDFTDSVSMYSIDRMYDWIINRPQSFAHFNHPGEYDDFDTEFTHFLLHSEAVDQMVGIENWNGNNGFDRYYYGGSWSSNDSYWDEGNKKGWYLGSLGSQDNHKPDWGTKNEFRTAVLAVDLSRESLIEAYKHRRFYATEDKDLYLDFRCHGYPMGSRLPSAETKFMVKALDKGGDLFQEVRLYRNGELFSVKSVSGNDISILIDDRSSDGNAAYYYVIVRQTDDNDGNGRPDEAISSPIWIDAASPPPSGSMPWIPLLLLDEQ